MMQSRDLIRNGFRAQIDAKKKYEKQLFSNPITELENDDIYILFSDLSEYKKDSKLAKKGFFSFVNNKKINIEILNNGDELVLSLYEYLGKHSPKALREQLIANVAAHVTKKGIAKAAATTAIEYPDYPKYVWIKGTYPLAAREYKGKDLLRGYQSITGKAGLAYQSSIEKVINTTKASYWKTHQKQAPTFLSKSEFQYAIDQDLSKQEGEKEQAPEGYFYNKKDGVNYEIFNTGTELRYMIWWGLPEKASTETKEKIIQSAQKKLSKYTNITNGAVSIKYYDNSTAQDSPSTGYLMYQMTYPIEKGSSTHADIKTGYNQLTGNTGKPINKVVKKTIQKSR